MYTKILQINNNLLPRKDKVMLYDIAYKTRQHELPAKHFQNNVGSVLMFENKSFKDVFLPVGSVVAVKREDLVAYATRKKVEIFMYGERKSVMLNRKLSEGKLGICIGDYEHDSSRQAVIVVAGRNYQISVFSQKGKSKVETRIASKSIPTDIKEHVICDEYIAFLSLPRKNSRVVTYVDRSTGEVSFQKVDARFSRISINFNGVEVTDSGSGFSFSDDVESKYLEF